METKTITTADIKGYGDYDTRNRWRPIYNLLNDLGEVIIEDMPPSFMAALSSHYRRPVATMRAHCRQIDPVRHPHKYRVWLEPK